MGRWCPPGTRTMRGGRPSGTSSTKRNRRVRGAVAPLVLNDSVLGHLHVAARGFPNRVVWNPGPGHGLPDVAPGDEARFVCIEPTTVVTITLPGHGTWEGRQHVFLG